MSVPVRPGPFCEGVRGPHGSQAAQKGTQRACLTQHPAPHHGEEHEARSGRDGGPQDTHARGRSHDSTRHVVGDHRIQRHVRVPRDGCDGKRGVGLGAGRMLAEAPPDRDPSSPTAMAMSAVRCTAEPSGATMATGAARARATPLLSYSFRQEGPSWSAGRTGDACGRREGAPRPSPAMRTVSGPLADAGLLLHHLTKHGRTTQPRQPALGRPRSPSPANNRAMATRLDLLAPDPHRPPTAVASSRTLSRRSATEAQDRRGQWSGPACHDPSHVRSSGPAAEFVRLNCRHPVGPGGRRSKCQTLAVPSSSRPGRRSSRRVCCGVLLSRCGDV